ncbi:MAG: trehalose-6-phosphate synthase [Bdellovibrionales bacterium CG10_big_fil_rev_8_21_14_0_10_45_34]|nr:MAG: trehalose-6-phosphate synthase [Bdellovibrionales bacterium CG10_big_fil_rev_8_21_14_0_10_45_34]
MFFENTNNEFLYWAQKIILISAAVLVLGVAFVGALKIVLRRRLADILQALRDTSKKPSRESVRSAQVAPFQKELRSLFAQYERKRSNTLDASLLFWNPETLKDVVRGELADRQVIVVSNREPYIHSRSDDGGEIEVLHPASGLVTAIEPIMRACSGTWIAHGSGNADNEVVDKQDHVSVPPEDPKYVLRRVWLSPEEEQGYYFGFANEGLWPLCHLAHTRPIFRAQDWQQYKAVNAKFAEAIVEEAQSKDPIVLVQDYHFALLPQMVREKLPDAVIITFWHIPWANPEVFSICPYKEELLKGLLGSSIIGFHTRFHCNNFLETVDRNLECRIDKELSAVTRKGEVTGVQAYPISIEWPPRWLENQPSVDVARKSVRSELGLPESVRLGVGVDRLDYTKGIVERFLAIERLLELQPKWIGHLTFVQIAAPSRAQIRAYNEFTKEVMELKDRINERFKNDLGVPPIILRYRHHDASEVFRFFRAADLCYVSSLHDGMNLVAKEFCAARDDYSGVLILSVFTGAARELAEALIVNPYDIDQTARALEEALVMPQQEVRERMRDLRDQIREYNIYRWAGTMLLDGLQVKRQNELVKLLV